MPKKILIIEDDDLLRGLITQKLSREDYKIVQAIDGEKGLRAVADEKPDLVLLDILLPGMNGFEVLEKIKADPTIVHTPVIILSNLWQKEDIDKGLALGAVDYLVKVNFASSDIIEKIKNILK